VQDSRIHEPNINCPYLNRKGWTTQVIHDDLGATLGEEAIAFGMMTKYIHEALICHGNTAAVSDATSPHIDDSSEAILRTLEELPFS
jgi:hypothetical protein